MVLGLWALLMVCKIKCEDLDAISKHECRLEGNRQTVPKEKLLHVGRFPCLCSLLFLLYSGTQYSVMCNLS